MTQRAACSTGLISRTWTSQWKRRGTVKERYSAQLRIEVYNVFNHVNFAQFSDGASDPSAGGGSVNQWQHLRLHHHGAVLGWNIAEPAIPVRFEVGLLRSWIAEGFSRLKLPAAEFLEAGSFTSTSLILAFALLAILGAQTAPPKSVDNVKIEKWNSTPLPGRVYTGLNLAPAPRRYLSRIWDATGDATGGPPRSPNQPNEYRVVPAGNGSPPGGDRRSRDRGSR